MPKNETTNKSKSEERREAIQKAEAEKTDVEETKTDGGDTPEEPKPATTEESGKDEVVEVSKTDLQAFMKRMDDLEATNKKLLDVADKGRMFKYSEEERANNAKIPTVKLTRIGLGGKLVIAWKMTKNESYVDGNRLIEHQEIEVFYQDGKSEKMPLLEFYRQQNKDTVGKIKSRTTDDSGAETVKVEMKDGELVEVGLKFVN